MMVRTSLVAGLALGLATVLASGALVRADGGAKAFSAPDQTSITTDSDINRMANVLRRGFRAIHDQALEPHTYSDLALAALSGLSTIDPALSVTTEDGIALVRVDGEAILAPPFPRWNRTRSGAVWWPRWRKRCAITGPPWPPSIWRP